MFIDTRQISDGKALIVNRLNRQDNSLDHLSRQLGLTFENLEIAGKFMLNYYVERTKKYLLG